MNDPNSARVRLSVDAARTLAQKALSAGGHGYGGEDARILADHMIDAALCGYEYSGLPKVLNTIEHPKWRRPRRPMKPLRETDLSLLFDGGNNCGMLTMYHASRAAIDKASRHGMALVGVTNTWVSGRSAYYVEMIARADLVGIHTVSAAAQVAPPGGAKAVLGTNPIAFGFPTVGEPLVIDMGTAAFMFTDLLFRERLGLPLPEGAAIDADGAPTRDPARARAGALLPFGDYKGFALGLAMQALGVLAGSGFNAAKDYGYLVIAIKPDLMIPLADFKQQMSELIQRIKATPRREGIAEIRIPSERSFRERARALREGIEIDRAIYDALAALGA
ncbi:MAG: Ldh family oxidoreductase [Burkholderiales bacterium]|nr:Ldh family oxidoreductase [Burkholderiales bacterium]